MHISIALLLLAASCNRSYCAYNKKYYMIQ